MTGHAYSHQDSHDGSLLTADTLSVNGEQRVRIRCDRHGERAVSHEFGVDEFDAMVAAIRTTPLEAGE